VEKIWKERLPPPRRLSARFSLVPAPLDPFANHLFKDSSGDIDCGVTDPFGCACCKKFNDFHPLMVFWISLEHKDALFAFPKETRKVQHGAFSRS
jgi:hypothetical protein